MVGAVVVVAPVVDDYRLDDYLYAVDLVHWYSGPVAVDAVWQVADFVRNRIAVLVWVFVVGLQTSVDSFVVIVGIEDFVAVDYPDVVVESDD